MKTPAACDDVRACFPLFVGGDLEEPSASRVREHLGACGECAAELASAERARSALLAHSLEAPEDLDLWQDLHLLLRGEGVLGARSPAAPGPLRSWRRLAGFAGAAAAVLVLGLGTWTGTAPSGLHDPADASGLATSLRATGGGARTARPRGSAQPLPFVATPVAFDRGALAAPAARSFAQRASASRVLPLAATVGTPRTTDPTGPAAGGQPHARSTGELRRATREDELLRNTALPWRHFFHRTPNVPIYWGENATVGFGLR